MLNVNVGVTVVVFSGNAPVFLRCVNLRCTSALVGKSFYLTGFLITLTVSIAVGSVFTPMFVALRGVASARVKGYNNSVGTLSAPVPVAHVFAKLG